MSLKIGHKYQDTKNNILTITNIKYNIIEFCMNNKSHKMTRNCMYSKMLKLVS